MNILRRLILSLALAAGIAPALAQVPPPVPALPDTERRTSYSITATTCACAVNFALYGDSTDYQSWVEVWLNGNMVASNDATFGWTITSPTGPLSTIPRPITDAVLTFNAVQTGTIQIVGARRPRRAAQFSENRGVAARDLNQVLTDIIAQNRETWDKINDVTGRVPLARPGETLALLPALASRLNQGACFDSGGNLTTCVSVPGSTFVAGSGITFTGTNPTTISATAGVVPQLAANNNWTGQNSFNGDTLFGSGRPWCDVTAKGAVHDGTTDDTPAFNACLTQILTTKGYGSGVIFIPPATNVYCIKTGIYVNTGSTSSGGIIFQGSGIQATSLSACGQNVTVLRTNNQWVSVRDLNVFGYGVFGTDPVFTTTPPTVPTIQCDSGGSFFNLHNVSIWGGTAGLELQCSNYDIENISVVGAYGDGTAGHVKAMVWTINGGGEIHDSHLDQDTPITRPTHGSGVSGWASAHAYTAGTVVTMTCNSVSWRVQAINNGTSGGSQPVCRPYNNYMSDNVTGSCPTPSAGVCWLIVMPADFYCMQLDSGSVEVQITHVDMTCAANYNLGLTGTFGGGPQQIDINNITAGAAFTGNIIFAAGSHVTMNGVEESNCIFAGCAAVTVGASFGGNLTSTNNRALNGLSYGWIIGGGSGYTVNGGMVTSADIAGIQLNAGTNIIINGGLYGTGITGTSIISAASAGVDYCIITNNIFHGATTAAFSQGAGSCTNKTVSGNL